MKDSENDCRWSGGIGRLLLAICGGMGCVLLALWAVPGILYWIVAIDTKPGWLLIIIIVGLLSILFIKGAWKGWHYGDH